jgi:hypothetical protein
MYFCMIVLVTLICDTNMFLLVNSTAGGSVDGEKWKMFDYSVFINRW